MQAPTLSAQQLEALAAVKAWFESKPRKPYFKLFGVAGVGKTFLAQYIARQIAKAPVYAAFSGKAALVLRSKGCHGAQTIHSLIYTPEELEDGDVNFNFNRKSPATMCDLIIIDEVSMVGKDLAEDLLKFNKPILVLGDPGQLPPIQTEGYFTSGKPDFLLTEIHRQAEGNPIIQLSMSARTGKAIKPGGYGESVVIGPRDPIPDDYLKYDQILCGTNKTRKFLNTECREMMGFEGQRPVKGDKLVCLKNNKRLGLLNGSLWTVSEVLREFPNGAMTLKLRSADGGTLSEPKVFVHEKFFGNEPHGMEYAELKKYSEFDYGYALTVHKAQGSQWDDILLFDESKVFGDIRNKLLYTAITRAAKRITVVLS